MFKESLLSYISNDQTFVESTITVQKYYDSLIRVITTSLQNARLTQNPNKVHKIFSERTLKLFKKRQVLQKSSNKTRATKNEISALYKLVNKYIKKDYADYRYKTIEKHLRRTGSTKKAYKELKQNKIWVGGLKQGKTTEKNRCDIISIATDYYRDLYNTQELDITSQENQNNSKYNNTHKSPQFEENDIIGALNKLKLDKSPGSDYLANETLKIAAPILASPFTKLFNSILESGETPTPNGLNPT